MCALMYAAMNGHPKIFSLLYYYEGKLCDSQKYTAQHYAARGNQLEILKTIAEIEKEVDYDVLIEAIKVDGVECLKYGILVTKAVEYSLIDKAAELDAAKCVKFLFNHYTLKLLKKHKA